VCGAVCSHQVIPQWHVTPGEHEHQLAAGARQTGVQGGGEGGGRDIQHPHAWHSGGRWAGAARPRTSDDHLERSRFSLGAQRANGLESLGFIVAGNQDRELGRRGIRRL
jgi:hypothetical protein